MNPEYIAFYLNTLSNVVKLDLLEFAHPSFAETHYVVRNAIAGVTVTHEDNTVHDYTYYPVSMNATGTSDNLDQSLKVSFGDLGTTIPGEIDAVRAADTMQTKPTLQYREYRSDTMSLINGPTTFQIDNIAFNSDGATVDAVAPRVNLVGTGERYDLVRFPTLIYA